MPFYDINLVTVPNQRAFGSQVNVAKDGLLSNAFIQIVQNDLVQEGRAYVEKRGGLITIGSALDAGESGVAVSDDGRVTAFKVGESRIYWDATLVGDLGSLGGTAKTITRCRLSGEDHWMIVTSLGSGWYLAFGALSGGATFTADTANGNASLTNVSSLAGLYVGQRVSGTGIVSGSRIASITAPSTILLDTPANATGTGITITRERISKILDSDFPSDATGQFVELNGRVFVLTRAGRIYQSAINDPQSWGASEFITANQSPDFGVSLFRLKNQIGAVMSNSTQWFYDAGNPSGSVLSRTEQAFSSIGGFYVNSGVTGDDVKTVASTKDMVVYQAGGTGSENGIYMISGGFEPQKISTPSVDKLISDDPAFISMFSASGGTYVVVSSSVSDFNYVYHVESKVWMTATFPFGTQFSSYISNAAGTSLGHSGIVAVCRDDTSGRRFSIESGYQDNGVAFSLSIRTQRLDLSNGLISTVEYYELDSDVQSSGTATLEVSDDDFQTWTTLGTFDMTKKAPRIYRGGAYRGGRAHRITHSANTPFRASKLRLKFKVGNT